jgi:hypothetical protein
LSDVRFGELHDPADVLSVEADRMASAGARDPAAVDMAREWVNRYPEVNDVLKSTTS